VLEGCSLTSARSRNRAVHARESAVHEVRLRPSPWLASECALQPREAIECSGWQSTLLNSSERVLDLLRRCHAHQGSHRRMRDRNRVAASVRLAANPLLHQR
jgi:hypothetical protein